MVNESWSANAFDPFEDIMHDMVIENNTVVCHRRVAMVEMQGARHGQQQDTVDILADGGSNIVLTGDESILEGVHSIPPVHIGLAAKGDTTPCTKQGWLPQLLSDGSILRTKAYVNSAATDTILSPEAILYSHPDLYRWEQQGFKGNNPGWLRFYSKSDRLMLSLPLKQKHNLYYYEYVRPGLASNRTIEADTPIDLCPFQTDHEDISAPNTTPTSTKLTAVDANSPTTVTFSDTVDIVNDSTDGQQKIPPPPRTPVFTTPVTLAQQTDSEKWAARLGLCGE